MQDHAGWYVTFKKSDTARRAAMVLNAGARTLAQQSVNVAVHFAPSFPSGPTKTTWDDAELIQQAEKIVLRDLKAMLEKDIGERVVGPELRRLILEEKARRAAEESKGVSMPASAGAGGGHKRARSGTVGSAASGRAGGESMGGRDV